jgi:hypothetical protein
MAKITRLVKRAIDQEKLERQEGADEREERRERVRRAEVQSLRKVIESQEQEIERLNKSVDLSCLLKENAKAHKPLSVGQSKSNSAIPIFIWSDWHVEEYVDRRKTLGKNEFDLEICEQRVNTCVRSTVKMIRHIRESSKVESVFLFLGGDFITGDIHQELVETNCLGPAEATVFARRLIATGLATIAEEAYLKKIRVACAVGNHGRTTKKMQFKNGTEKSFETIIYAELASEFNSSRFEWEISKGGVGMSWLSDEFGVRTAHGHQIRYAGGIGGLTIPLTKWIHRQDQTIQAGFNLIGHHHQYGLPTGRCLGNGSLIGWTEYAAENGFSYEPPQQAGCVYDVTRNRVTGVFPVFCE